MLDTSLIQEVEWLQWGAVIGVSLAAAIVDVRRGLIPNVLTHPLWLMGIAVAVYFDGLSGFLTALAVSVTLALPYVLLTLVANGGAGDAKLMGAIGAWLSLREGLVVLSCVAITGAVLAILRILVHRRRQALSLTVLTSLYSMMFMCCSGVRCFGIARTAVEQSRAQNLQERVTMPYGVAIFIGVLSAAVAIGATSWVR